MIFRHATAIILAYLIDLAIGDTQTWPHPVKMIGSLISFLDQKLNNNRKVNGVGMLAIVLTLVSVISLIFLVIAYQLHFLFGLILESILIATTISQKGLKDAALAVYRPLEHEELPLARKQLAHIVGRDTATLNDAEITRATIETVAENTTDGITAPIFWAIFLGGVGAMAYRAINTCDSMVGYQNEKYQQFGWASAKLDDIVNWLPARLTGIVMLYLTNNRLNTHKNSIADLKNEAEKHASPNSGWTEAAVALALGIELGGDNYYDGILSPAPKIGRNTRAIENEDIQKTIYAMQGTTLFFIIIITLGASIYGLT